MDEMDLMKKLREVPSPSPEAYDRARTALHTAMEEPVNPVVRPKRWFSWPKVSIAAAGAAAVVTAVVLGATGGTAPTGPSSAAPQVVESPLVELASEVQAAVTLPGDASLVITKKLAPDKTTYTVYTVYTDKGQVFHGDSVKGLAATAAKGDDSAHPYDAKVAAAARLAATGDVEKAKIAMVTASGTNRWGLGLSPAEAEKAWAQSYADMAETLRKLGKEVPPAKPRPTGKELENGINNALWSNTTYALFVAASNADVRAGVLKLLATIQDVTIGKTEVDGQPALTLTAGPALQGGTGSHVLTVNADNGLPIRSEVVPAKDAAEPSTPSAVHYKSSRVNFADVIAGKI
ncbi:hypothetical protein SAMN05216188_10713 [Lentzea xinjiangensis]|uniref:CU044_5270 family protein n=1 Tax=Lentzea xinjiangensis TaxID=402600 RepID=A0A1H9KKS5_9PSEU|nr:hypothetical protein [Lentzea xinjiangensis]SEQ99740.1 hypothetical protein SAMN05216188_10713 [Lentzea xinjiangensis]